MNGDIRQEGRTFRFYIGTGQDWGVGQIDRARKKLKDIANNYFVGWTLIEARGCYEGQEEHTFILEVFTDLKDRFIENFVTDIKQGLWQECVGVIKLPPMKLK